MSHVCFVTDELYPVTGGGAGTLIHNSARLLDARGHSVSVLLDVDHGLEEAQVWWREHRAAHGIRALYGVTDLTRNQPIPTDEEFTQWYNWRSYRAYLALREICGSVRVDLVEFNDFYGVGYYALAAKLAGIAFDATRLAVRLHTPWEMLLRYGGETTVAPHVLAIRALERGALRLAEDVLVPSAAYADAVYRRHYPRGLGRVSVSRPAVVAGPAPRGTDGADDGRDVILFYGRLFGFKGPERLVAAAIEVMAALPRVELWFVGGDSTVERDGMTVARSELLRQRVPGPLRDRVRFFGRLSFEEVGTVLPRVRCAVFPSYVESFCYGAHELRRAGVPIVVSATPALSGEFGLGRGGRVFDGTTDGLVRLLTQVFSEESLCRAMAEEAAESDEDLGGFYDAIPRASWMERGRRGDARTELLVAVLGHDAAGAQRTLDSIGGDLVAGDAALVLEPVGEAGEGPVVFLGQLFEVRGPTGRALRAEEVRTKDALLILSAGDEVLGGALRRWRDVLARHPEVAFVGGWKVLGPADGVERLDCAPIELRLDEMLFAERSLRQRVLMRTPANRRLDDLFDARLGALGEIGCLCRLDAEHGPGVTVPEPGLRCAPGPVVVAATAFPDAASFLLSQEWMAPQREGLTLRLLLPRAAGAAG